MSSNYCSVFCIRFDFGLPLEDICPPNDLHPKIKKLLHHTYSAVVDYPYSIHHILTSRELTKEYGYQCVEHVFSKCRLYSVKYDNPCAFLWVVRHFLENLPLALFPLYTDCTRFNWDWLALLCRLHKRVSVNLLNREISKTLAKLPQINLIMIDNLLEFFKKIIRCKTGCFKPKDTLAVVKYFSSRLFIRPINNEEPNAYDLLYYPLTYYLIVKWSNIKKIGILDIKLNQAIIEDDFDLEEFIRSCQLSSREPSSDFSYDYRQTAPPEPIQVAKQEVVFNRKKHRTIPDIDEKNASLSPKLNEDEEEREDLSEDRRSKIFSKRSLTQLLSAAQHYFFHGRFPKTQRDSVEETLLAGSRSVSDVKKTSVFGAKIDVPTKREKIKYKKLLTI